MSIVVLRKPENVLSGTTEQVVIGDATRTIDSLQRDADGVVQDITGWTATIIGHSDDLPGVFFDVPGEIVSPASAGVFRWTRVGDFLTQIGEKSRARFTCQVKTVNEAGLVGYGAEFGLDFVVDGTGEDTNMNAAAVQAMIATTFGHPFEFPFTGNIRTANPVVGVQLTSSGQRETVFSSPIGTRGVVRNVAWITEATFGLSSVDVDLFFEVTYGDDESPSISVPLFVLAGMEYHEFALKELFASTYAFELTSGPHIGDAPWGTKFGSSGNWRLPMPYDNGIRIEIVAGTKGYTNTIFCNTTYQDDLASCWNDNLRLCAARSNETLGVASASGPSNAHFTSATQAVATSGTWPSNIVGKSIIMDGVSFNDMLVIQRNSSTVITISAKDSDHLEIGPSAVPVIVHNHTFISRPSGEAGYVAMVVGGCLNAGGDGDLVFEGNVRMFLDGEATPSLEWSSVEDFANGSYYFEQKHQSDEGGIMAKDLVGSTAWSIYKLFHRQPVKYTNGFAASVPQYSSFDSTTFKWTTFYYRVMA